MRASSMIAWIDVDSVETCEEASLRRMTLYSAPSEIISVRAGEMQVTRSVHVPVRSPKNRSASGKVADRPPQHTRVLRSVDHRRSNNAVCAPETPAYVWASSSSAKRGRCESLLVTPKTDLYSVSERR